MMPAKTLEEELLEQLKPGILSGDILVSTDIDVYFDGIWQHFPFSGSKIKWSQVPNSIEKQSEGQSYKATAMEFYDKVFDILDLSSTDKVIVVGDSAIDIALIFKSYSLKAYISQLFDLPQHTYIVPYNFSWCLCYTMEGYMNFGFSPAKL